jgi:HEAT repeat protein
VALIHLVPTFALVSLIAGASAAAPQDGEGTEVPLSERVEQILASGATAEVAERELAGLDGPVVPTLLERLEGARQRNASEEQALRGALHLLGRGAVLPLIAERASDAATPSHAEALLRALTCVGHGADLRVAVAVAAGVPPETAGSARVLLAVEELTTALVLRDPGALAQLPSLMEAAPLEIASALVRGAAEAGTADVVSLFNRLLGQTPALDAALLTGLARAGRFQHPPLASDVSRELQRHLEHDDENVVRAALHAAGELEDFSTTARCVELADAPSSAIRDSAHRALERLTGQRLARGGWRNWFESEARWFDEQAVAALEDISGDHEGRRLRGITVLVGHTYRRHELALAVVDLSNTAQSAELRRLACAALGQLGSRAAIPGLYARLEDPDARVALEAQRALRALTHQELDADPEAWKHVRDGTRPPLKGSRACCAPLLEG